MGKGIGQEVKGQGNNLIRGERNIIQRTAASKSYYLVLDNKHLLY